MKITVSIVSLLALVVIYNPANINGRSMYVNNEARVAGVNKTENAPVSFFINSFSIPQTYQVVVPVKVAGFDSILSAQGTITFDTAMLIFASIDQMGLPGMNASQFGTTSALTDSGRITYAWNAGTDTVSVADSTVIFAIRFSVKGQAGMQTTVHFSGTSLPQEVLDIHSNAVTANYTDGQMIIPCSEFFTIFSDPHQLHHYILTNYPNAAGPAKYDWKWGDGSPDDTIPYPVHVYDTAGFYNISVTLTDSTGCQASYFDSSEFILRSTNTMIYITVVNPLVTGINEAEQQVFNITLYPNPATEKLYVTCPQLAGNEILTVYNTLGAIVYTHGINSPQETIDCRQLPAGIYFVEIKTGSLHIVKKFVRE